MEKPYKNPIGVASGGALRGFQLHTDEHLSAMAC